MAKIIPNPVHADELQLYPDESKFVAVAGDTMTGDLNFPATGYVMRDTNGVRWRVTVGTDGALITTQIVTTGELGSPWLWMFGTI